MGALTVTVVGYAVAMAYVESATVVYLRTALGAGIGDVFPIDVSVSPLGLVELGREAATLLMIAAVGWLAGRSSLDRLAWAAVVVGVWDIGYYLWLRILSGWPPELATWDLLFLLPVPWAAPVWAPVVVSLALIGYGIAMASRLHAGAEPRLSRVQVAGLISGGALVVISFVMNAGIVIAGKAPQVFPWPVFVAGLLLGIAAATAVLVSGRPLLR